MNAARIIATPFALTATNSFATDPPLNGRKLAEVDVVPKRVLQRSISPWFYKSLLVSPIEGRVIVRRQLSGSKLHGARVVRSDPGGAYDPVALQFTKELNIAGNLTVGSQTRFSQVLRHTLIYKIGDGTMALSFPILEGKDQLDYFGCAKLAVLKETGSGLKSKDRQDCTAKAGRSCRPKPKTSQTGVSFSEKVDDGPLTPQVTVAASS